MTTFTFVCGKGHKRFVKHFITGKGGGVMAIVKTTLIAACLDGYAE